MKYIIVLAITASSFAIQIWPRLKNRYFGIDTWRFALLADYIRKNRRLPESIGEKYIVPGLVDNPPVLPLILSLFNKDWLDRNQAFISPLFDALHSVTIFFIGYKLTGVPLGGYIAQIVYLLSPVVPLEASNLSLRSISGLFFTWTMIAVQSFVMVPDLANMGIAVFFIVLLAYTHRMSLQVLFFTLILFSLIENNFKYLIVFFTGLGISIFLFNGLYLKYLRGQILLIAFWMYNIQNRLAHQIRGNPSLKRKHSDFVRNIEYLIWKIPVFPLLAVNPWIIFLTCYTVLGYGNYIEAGRFGIWFAVFVKWSLIVFLLGFIFNLKHLRFLGEGQRYLEYSTSAVAVATASLVVKYYSDVVIGFWFKIALYFIGVVCLSMILFFQKRIIVNNPDKSITDDLWSIINYLNERMSEVRIACIPHGLADALAYFLIKAKVLLSDNSLGVWELQQFWPVLKRPLNEIAGLYNLNFILVSKNYVNLDEISIKGFEIVYEKGPYVLLEQQEDKKKA